MKAPPECKVIVRTRDGRQWSELGPEERQAIAQRMWTNFWPLALQAARAEQQAKTGA